jgi:cardiolipin synthase A/B
VAQAEDLDLQARRRNPTGQGIHNKMVLAQTGGRGWTVVGSLNGGEVSAKLNQEMALLGGSDEVYDYLADVFSYDWDVIP